MSKICVQKGRVNPNPVASKQMSHGERLKEAEMRSKEVERAQSLDFYTPKR